MKPNYELLKDAYSIIDGIPADLINLDKIYTNLGERPDCGTIACAAGFLALHPQFQALGLMPYMEDGIQFEGAFGWYAKVMAELFSLSCVDAIQIFSPRGSSTYDVGMSALPHKELFLHRVTQFLKEEGQLCHPANSLRLTLKHPRSHMTLPKTAAQKCT